MSTSGTPRKLLGLQLPIRELIIAPMVDQSELAFRQMCREKFGATLCYSPMMNCKIFLKSEAYRREKFTTCAADRPLVVQFCGHDKHLLLQAAEMVQDKCDMIDLNLGCPQNIARKGKYGAFLMDTEPETVFDIVSHLSKHLKIPVSCKIRLTSSVEKTVEVAKKLEESGCSLLAVHGRTKEQKKLLAGRCDWVAIKKVKEAVSIPVFANGGIGTFGNTKACLDATGADGVLSAEAILENPSLIKEGNPVLTPAQITLMYLDYAEKYGEPFKITRAHVFRFLHGQFKAHAALRDTVFKVNSKKPLSAFREPIQELERIHSQGECVLEICKAQDGTAYGPYYDRHMMENKKYYSDAKVIGNSAMDREEVIRKRAERKIRKQQGKAQNLINKKRRQEAHQKGLQRKRKKQEYAKKIVQAQQDLIQSHQSRATNTNSSN